MDFNKDDFVRLPADQGGTVGRVIEDQAGGKVRIHFPGEGVRVFRAAECALTKVEPGDETASVIERLKVRARKPSGKTWALPELITLFKTEFPDGFQGKDYELAERGYKIKACELLLTTLGKEDFQTLLGNGRYEEICTRARRMLSATNLTHQFEVMALGNGLKPETSWRPFSEALFELLYGESEREQRFTRFVGCLAGLKAAKWPNATYFQYLANPEQELFLKPEATKMLSAACGVELNYRALPNWLTYTCLLDLAKKLGVSLTEAGLKPKDMIDIQSFIWTAYRLAQGH